MKILALANFCVDVFPQSGKILPGGESLNLGVNCKQDGADVFVMGNIGNDEYGKILKNAVDKNGLNSEKIYEVAGVTANHVIHIDEHGDRYFKAGAWTGGVLVNFKISAEDKKFLNTMDAVATTVVAPDFENIIMSVSADAGKRPLTAVDFQDEKLKPEYEKYFPHIDLFFISGKNQDSAEFHQKLKEWSEKYNTIFTATLAENGSVSYKNGAEFVCQAEKVEQVIDTTGCGDSYQAGFIVEYLKSKDVEKSMKNGSKFAAKTLSYIGGFK